VTFHDEDRRPFIDEAFKVERQAMRLGIFSDVHANLEALQAVLQAYEIAQIDRYVCLGDIVGYGADPNACCQLVRERTDFVVVGNHDAACCGRMRPDSFNPAARTAVEWHSQMLDAAHMNWLRQLPYHLVQDEMLFCHGSPFEVENFRYILDEADVEDIVRQVVNHPPLVFVGHTHRGTTFIARETPAWRIWEDASDNIKVLAENTYVFNVGSVGQPRDGDWRASYAIFDTATQRLERKRVEYDVDAASDKIARLGLPLSLSERLHLGV
jgi:diadenosine tetraphosphatase ApaH/serine/threonine PP2A family protein phosphatase